MVFMAEPLSHYDSFGLNCLAVTLEAYYGKIGDLSGICLRCAVWHSIFDLIPPRIKKKKKKMKHMCDTPVV